MLTLSDISHAYRRGTPVLSGVGLAAESGRITVLVGPNGSGKSTLLRTAAGLLDPTKGRATVGDPGAPVRSLAASERARRLAYIPQRTSLAFAYSLRAFVRFGRVAIGQSDPAIERAIKTVSLLDRADEPFGELSVGQQQLASLARALAQLDPPCQGQVLIADEPTSAMDPAHTLKTRGALRDLAGAGVAILIAVHDLTLARRLADDAVVLGSGGTALARGPASETLTPEILASAFGVAFEQHGDDLLVPTDTLSRVHSQS